MITKQWRLVFFILVSLPSFAANDNTMQGARTKGMGDVAVAIPCFWSICNNQAIMPFYGKMAVGAYYDNRYLLKETSTAVFGFHYPLKNGRDVFGASLQHYGGSAFGEMKAAIAYAKSFGGVFSFGLQFDYLHTSFGDASYGQRDGFTFEVGLYGQVTKSLSFGFHVYNPARLKMITYNDVAEYIPTVLQLGIAYTFRKKCLIGLDIEKNIDTKMQCRAGVEYTFTDYLIIRGGLRLPDFSFTAGIGTAWKGLRFDFASSYHPQLGYSPQISLLYIIR